MLERARIVQTVHQLDDEDADVFCGRRKELAERFRVPLKSAIPQGPELGHAFDEREHIRPEVFRYLFRLHARVLDSIVQEPCRDGLCVQPRVRQKKAHFGGVCEVRVARIAFLVFVRFLREIVCLCDE